MIRFCIAGLLALNGTAQPAGCPLAQRGWEFEALCRTLGGGAGADPKLRHRHGPDAHAPEYAYATILAGGVRRSVVVLKEGAVVTFETGLDGDAERVTIRDCGANLEQGSVESLDLAGARLGGRVVLFHADPRSATSAVSFDAAGPARLKFLVAGLAVGTWEIWRNGFLMDAGGAVERDSGLLSFEGPPGGYFLRRIG